MSRDDVARLLDIEAAISAVHGHLERGGLDDGLVLDAVRVRLIEIGEAAKALSTRTTRREPSVPWADVAGMRDHLAHRYFDTDHAIVAATIEHDLPPLLAAVRRLLPDPDAR